MTALPSRSRPPATAGFTHIEVLVAVFNGSVNALTHGG